MRSALGGSRWRLVRQMIAESLVLAVGGALLGLGLAQLGIDLLHAPPSRQPAAHRRRDDRSVRARVRRRASALVAALLFGVVPAWRASRPDLMDVLRTSGRTAALGGGRLLRSGVVMAEVALAFVLLIGCGLMLRSFVALQRIDPGFDPNGVLTFNLQVQGPRYRQPAQRDAFIKQLRERLGALPGVTAVTAANPLPLDGDLLANGRWGTEEAAADPGKFQQSSVYFVLPGYFEAMKTPLLEGRTFTDADNVPDTMKIVVDRRLAKKAFPTVGGRQPILARTGRSVEAERFEIIGVVEHQRGRHARERRAGDHLLRRRIPGPRHRASGGRCGPRRSASGWRRPCAPKSRGWIRALPVSQIQPMTGVPDARGGRDALRARAHRRLRRGRGGARGDRSLRRAVDDGEAADGGDRRADGLRRAAVEHLPADGRPRPAAQRRRHRGRPRRRLRPDARHDLDARRRRADRPADVRQHRGRVPRYRRAGLVAAGPPGSPARPDRRAARRVAPAPLSLLVSEWPARTCRASLFSSSDLIPVRRLNHNK